MTLEEFQKLKNEILSETDERYVRISECNETQANNEKKHFSIEKNVESNKQKIGLHDKIFWLIASGIIGGLVLSFLDLVLK